MSSSNVCGSLAGGVSTSDIAPKPVQEGDLHTNGDFQYAPHLEVREGGPHLQVREGGHHHPTCRAICRHQQVRAALSRSLPLHLQ